MAWTLGGVRIYVEEDSGWKPEPRIGEINVLDSSKTIIHRAGRPSYTRSIQFVVFSGYHDNILPLANASTTLINDQGDNLNIHITGMDPTRLVDISRDTEVHRVKLDCIEDDS